LPIPEGFYSVVQKPGDGDLCVRARDLDRLRDAYMSGLGPTKETPGHDYRYRAWISRDALAEGLAALAQTLAYSKSRVLQPSAELSDGARRPTLSYASCTCHRRGGGSAGRSS
jgi:hypothetical protein